MDALYKLSGRKDIEKLYNRYGTYFLKKNQVVVETLIAEIWKNIQEEQNKFSENFYFAILSSFGWNQLERQIKSNKSVDNEQVLSVVRSSLLDDISMLLISILEAESRNRAIDMDSYIKKLMSNKIELERLFDKYLYCLSVLSKMITKKIHFLKVFFVNLENDAQEVMMSFFGDIAIIQDIKLSMGDQHNGKSVVKIISSLGSFFYKPRSAKVDICFNEILNTISNNKKILDMKSVEVVDCDEYSWFKEVEYVPLNNETDERNYYIRLGQLSALIYILNGGDVHYENVISNGEYPVIIDIESLLDNRLRFKNNLTPEYLKRDTNNCVEDTVKETLILPDIFYMQNRYFDFSPFKIFDGTIPNTQEDINKKNNHIIKKDSIEKITTFFLAGFRSLYLEIANRKKYYISYFKQLFKGIRVRYLNKPTNDYAQIRRLLFNPVCLHSFKFSFAVSAKIFSEKVVPLIELEEQESLLNLDIPYFEVEVESLDLKTVGNAKIENFFIETPLESLIYKIDVLGKEDLERQSRIIEQMFKMVSKKCISRELSEIPSKILSVKNVDVSYNLENEVKDIFAECVINPVTKQYYWVGPELVGDITTGNYFYKNVNFPNSYYVGNIGILKGLLLLGDLKKYSKFIDKLVNDIEFDIKQILESDSRYFNIGAYNGLAQYLRFYVLLYESKLITLKYLQKSTKKILEILKTSIPHDTKLDILDGTAGVALVLIKLYSMDVEQSLKEEIKNLLRLCRKHLKESLVYKNNECYFPFEQDKARFFTGFAHGTSGIVFSLCKISKLLKYNDDKVIEKILETERKYYDPDKKIWYKDNQKRDYAWGWCHGIPGILLSRIGLMENGYMDDKLNDEISNLYELSLEYSFGSNLTLCHGDIGNIIICKYVEKKMSIEDNRLDKYIDTLIPKLFEAKNLNIRGTEAPGLMTGMMGVISFIKVINESTIESLIDILKITKD